jgi:surface antigen
MPARVFEGGIARRFYWLSGPSSGRPFLFEAVYESGMNRLAVILLLLPAAGAASVAAQPQSIPGMIAKKETDLLTYEDKLAAYDAEQAVLSNEWNTLGYNWNGPNGAYGTIIAQGALPQTDGKRYCRRFIHIVHHANDAGANPTFQGVVCRDEGAEWRQRQP